MRQVGGLWGDGHIYVTSLHDAHAKDAVIKCTIIFAFETWKRNVYWRGKTVVEGRGKGIMEGEGRV